MSKPRHAVQSTSRKRSLWIALVALLVLGLVSAGFWFSSQSSPQPTPTPTVTATATPSPTVTPSPEPTPTETTTPTPTLEENELPFRFSSKGKTVGDDRFKLKGYVGDSNVRTNFHALLTLFDQFQDGQTYIVTVSYDEADGVPLITSVRQNF